MCKVSVLPDQDFTTRFYQASQLTKENQQNFVSSPASLLVLLSLLFSSRGPQGNTRTQICQTITGQNEECNERMVQKIDKQLRKITRAVEETTDINGSKVVTISNAAFVQNEFEVLPSFVQAFSQDGVNKVERTNFQTDQGFQDINNWANSSTGGLIKKLYNEPKELSSDTLLVLLNTILFTNGFRSTFSKFLTQSGKFRSTEHSIDISMMSKMEMMEYSKNEAAGYHLIGMNFQVSPYKFLVILPLTRNNLGAVDIALKNNFNWTAVGEGLETKFVNLTMPRFKLEHEIDLKTTLQFMKITDLFSEALCDLSGINGEGQLFAKEAKQKVVLEISESGVKAAAVSSISISPRSRLPSKAVSFNVDEPFFCAIYDSSLRMPLFLARVVKPEPL